jgi:hypothetical protein
VAGFLLCCRGAWPSRPCCALAGLRCLPARFGNTEKRLRAELEQEFQTRLALARQEAAQEQAALPLRQAPEGDRLYAAPDGVRYCTTERDQETGKVRWRELKGAAVYEATPASEEGGSPHCREESDGPPLHEPVRARLARWLREQQPPSSVAALDQATRVTSGAETRSWEQFGPRLWAELSQRGLGSLVQDVVVVADGSDHIDQALDSELRLPGVHLTRILDIAHAQQPLWAVSNAAFGEGSAAGKNWVQPLLLALERGMVDEVVGH